MIINIAHLSTSLIDTIDLRVLVSGMLTKTIQWSLKSRIYHEVCTP